MDDFTLAYIEAALWSTNDQSNEQGGEPLDKNYTIDDIDAAALASAAQKVWDEEAAKSARNAKAIEMLREIGRAAGRIK